MSFNLNSDDEKDESKWWNKSFVIDYNSNWWNQSSGLNSIRSESEDNSSSGLDSTVVTVDAHPMSSVVPLVSYDRTEVRRVYESDEVVGVVVDVHSIKNDNGDVIAIEINDKKAEVYELVQKTEYSLVFIS
jgi:hypothetical protein